MKNLQINASEQWKSIKKFMHLGEFTIVITAAGSLLEVILRYVLQQAYLNLEYKKQRNYSLGV